MKTKKAFTLIELLVVVAIIGILATIVVVNVSSARKKSRDTRRVADMKQVQTALDMYLDKEGKYPDTNADSDCDGFDSSGDGDFLSVLATSGFLSSSVKDPTKNTACYNYRYFRYSDMNWNQTQNCPYIWYVLGIRDMETSGNPYPDSPGLTCGNWTSGWIGEWTTGKFEK